MKNIILATSTGEPFIYSKFPSPRKMAALLFIKHRQGLGKQSYNPGTKKDRCIIHGGATLEHFNYRNSSLSYSDEQFHCTVSKNSPRSPYFAFNVTREVAAREFLRRIFTPAVSFLIGEECSSGGQAFRRSDRTFSTRDSIKRYTTVSVSQKHTDCLRRVSPPQRRSYCRRGGG